MRDISYVGLMKSVERCRAASLPDSLRNLNLWEELLYVAQFSGKEIRYVCSNC